MRITPKGQPVIGAFPSYSVHASSLQLASTPTQDPAHTKVVSATPTASSSSCLPTAGRSIRASPPSGSSRIPDPILRRCRPPPLLLGCDHPRWPAALWSQSPRRHGGGGGPRASPLTGRVAVTVLTGDGSGCWLEACEESLCLCHQRGRNIWNHPFPLLLAVNKDTDCGCRAETRKVPGP